jgi:hypothetical protein
MARLRYDPRANQGSDPPQRTDPLLTVNFEIHGVKAVARRQYVWQ